MSSNLFGLMRKNIPLSLKDAGYKRFLEENWFDVTKYASVTQGTCSGLEYSGWSIPVSFMLILVTLSLHRKLSFFIEFFKHIVYRWMVMIYTLSDTFYIIHIVVYIVHKSCSYRGEGKK